MVIEAIDGNPPFPSECASSFHIGLKLPKGGSVSKRPSLPLAFAASTALVASLVSGPPVAAVSGFTDRQGVDACDYPSSSDLQALFTGTPFFDFGYYLGGAEAAAVGCAAWTSSTRTAARSIGWGFTPIWDDLQAPTGCGPIINGVRHDFAARMSASTTTAFNQGVTSANNALAAMTSAGFLSSDNVWLDVEAYDRTQTACKNAVNAYVNGWSSVTGASGGVYGSSSGSGVSDWASLANPPWAVWMAWTGGAVNTVWGITSVSNSLWVPDHRIHQYRTSQHKVAVSMPHGYDVDCLNTWGDQGSNADDESSESSESASQTGDAACLGTAQ